MGDITARRLREAMRDMKAVELCEKSGVSKYSVSQYLNGKNAPNNKNAELMGKALGVNPLWLMGYDVSKEPQSEETCNLMAGGNRYELPPEMLTAILTMIDQYKK